jgi:cytosine/adenosine deaminase-related metal-dependent hydrolase
MPLSIHLAESAEEEPFTRSATGCLAELLRELGVWDRHVPASGCGPFELARKTGVLGRRTVVAHANYVADADIALIAAAGASVAYCPRTHRAFRHPPHRFREMLAAGINVCVGTDSLASNPSLSVLDELRFLRLEYPDWPADELLAMGTLRGACALGLAAACGSVSVGKSADLSVVPLEDNTRAGRWDGILESEGAPLAVFVAGVPQSI